MKTATFYNNSPLSGSIFGSHSTEFAKFATRKMTKTIKAPIPGSAEKKLYRHV